MTKPRLFRPRLEALESRIVPTSVCDANSVYRGECNYLDALIPQSAITITAVQSGNWSDPATWGGRTPTTGDNVWIPNGIAVTVDGQESGAIRSVLDNGLLSFAPNVNTSLTVNTIVTGTDTQTPGTPQGELDIGTAANPIQAGVSAQLIFADSQSLSAGMTQAQLFPNDPQELSGGLISMGTLNIYGSEVTPYVNLSGNAVSGSASLDLASVPVGWNVGDTVLIAGDRPEEASITAIQANADGTATLLLSAPLQFDHSAPAGQSVQVADENRSVVFRDEGTATQHADGSEGHVMQMHNDAAAVYYAAFLDPGRTDKSVPLGSTLSNGTTNVAGRYSFHFHRDYWKGITDNDPAMQVVGCFQANSPGWGYDNHSSNADFINDVAFNDFGAAFVDQAGNELGSWQGCLAVTIPGVPGTASLLEQRASKSDFGWNGQGFWLQSPSTNVIDCHVWDAQIGFSEYSQGLVQGPLGRTQPFGGGLVSGAPLAEFSGDTAGGVNVGLTLWWRQSSPTWDTITDFSAWDVSGIGVIATLYSNHTRLVNPVLSGVGKAAYGVYSNPFYSYSVDLQNPTIAGFNVGVNAVVGSTETIEGGSFDCPIAIRIPPLYFTRTISLTGDVSFGPSTVDKLFFVPLDLYQWLKNPGIGFAEGPFSKETITLPDGTQVYEPQQAPDYVLFNGFGPTQLQGLTNAELWSQYGLALGDWLPADVTASAAPWTNGFVGVPRPQAATILTSPYRASHSSPYTLKVDSWANGVKTSYSWTVSLQAGLNVLTEVINGQTHSWLVYGN